MKPIRASRATDKPWRRSGGFQYALERIGDILRPPIKIIQAKAGTYVFERNLEVRMRDGVKLRVNAFRPTNEGRFPTILSAHPYGKDNFPRKQLGVNRLPIQYRVLRQKGPIVFSTFTTWEAPDPMSWVAHGYAVVNADLRGCGASEGVGSILSDQEGEDVYDLIEWAADQSWSTGKIGMCGVSYLALSQYKSASLRPPALAAICAWEGFTDAYADFAYQGGIREDGFARMWSRQLKKNHLAFDIRDFSAAHPLRDESWQSLVPELASIEVPLLVCGSFSDHCLHSRGSFRLFCEAGSSYKELYTHRGAKWTEFYSEQAFEAQLSFFDRFLKSDQKVPPATKVRLEVRSSREKIAKVREELSWPLERTVWTSLYLTSNGALSMSTPPIDGEATFEIRSEAARFSWRVPKDTELTGPMAAHLWLKLDSIADIDLFVGVELWRRGKYVPFEGSYGYGRDRVATGWQKASLRELDLERSRPWAPEHAFLKPQPLGKDEIATVDVTLGPSATLFLKDDEFRFVVAGRWLSPTGLLTGQFPAAYSVRPEGQCKLLWGPERPAHLLIPVIPV